MPGCQDTSSFSSQSKTAGAGVSVCIPPICYGEVVSVSASLSAAKVNGDFKSVAEQSGIKAGDGGFQIKIKGNTELKGGVIVSSQTAVEQNKNSLSTAALKTSDLQNRDDYAASGLSLSGSVSGTVGDQTSAAARQNMSGQLVALTLVGGTLVGAPALGAALAGAPAAGAAVVAGLRACASNPLACANTAGVMAADAASAEALGGASLSGGLLAVGAAGKLVSATDQAATDAAAAARAAKLADETDALKVIAQNNGSLGAKIDNSVLNRSDALLANDLAARAKVRPDTSNDVYYAANTDQSVLKNNNFDMDHVLSGEINAKGKATGYHVEIAADGAARITPGATVTQNPNGTYQAPVQIWDDATKQWVDKFAQSTFFPPSWSEKRITYEVAEAFKAATISGSKWTGISPSGVVIEGYINSTRVTFYPIGKP